MRRALLVGSLPASDASAAMELAMSRLGSDLDFLPDGETGERRNWIISMIEGFRGHPDLEVAKEGDWSDYDRTPRFRVRSGHRLYGASMDLGIAAAARDSWEAFGKARSQVEDGHPLGFQVGIPGNLDLAVFTFGPTGPVRYARPFAEALVASMRQVHDLAGETAIFQLELPVELVMLARAPSRARPALARILAGRIASLVLGAPAGSRFGIHLCLGDMNHQALGRMTDAGPLVAFANAIVRAWPAGRALVYLHAPLAAADKPPIADPAFYAPLGGLDLGGVRLIAGYAHEDQDLAVQQRIRGLIEDAVGHRVDVSTSCGLGRRQPVAATAALDRIAALLPD